MKKQNNKKSQQLLFLEGLLQSIKKGNSQQNKPFKIGVTEKYEGIKAELEIYPNCKGFLVWRIITSAGCGIWQCWETEEEIEKTFKLFSLV